MRVAPITIRLAKRLVVDLHRREPSLTGALWAAGLVVDGRVVGCAVVGRPKARRFDSAADAPKDALEVVRVAVPEGLRIGGHGGACSMLYGACARAARGLGARDLLTYVHADEPGTSLRAAGWMREDDAAGGGTDRVWRRAMGPREAAASAADRGRTQASVVGPVERLSARSGGRMTDSPRKVTRCDKAHHGAEAPAAAVVLRCQGCGRVYARCADCERYRPGSAEAALRAHLRTSYCLSRAARRGR